MRRPFLLFMGFGCLASCHKTEFNPNKSWEWFGTNNPVVYSYVLINANQVASRADSNDFHIAIAAAFIDSLNNKITGIDNLYVNNLPISMNVDSTFSFDYGASASLNQGLALYGTNVCVSIKGNSNDDTVTTSVYLPKRLINVITDFPDAVDLSKDVELKWAPDQGNKWGNVIIQVYYYPGLSQASDSTLPKQIRTLNLTVPDNGSYIIQKEMLQSFPRKSFIGISIARGTQNEAVLPVSRKRVFYFTNSSASTQPLFVFSN
ncbi:MAG: hypothetical protein C5B59_06140 [Bacteroidetes bacterium]|nr:MAG: hypothetical protein C5B59_06140 [Bacteroidota bacterium]